MGHQLMKNQQHSAAYVANAKLLTSPFHHVIKSVEHDTKNHITDKHTNIYSLFFVYFSQQ